MKVFLKNDVIREIIIRNNITQEHLSTTIGISRGYLSMIINGHNSISAKLRIKLLSILGFNEDDFDKLFVIGKPTNNKQGEDQNERESETSQETNCQIK